MSDSSRERLKAATAIHGSDKDRAAFGVSCNAAPVFDREETLRAKHFKHITLDAGAATPNQAALLA